MKEPQKILEELIGSKPEELTGEAKRLFEAIMKIADERDELLKERQADKEKINKLEKHLKFYEKDESYKKRILELEEENFKIKHLMRNPCDIPIERVNNTIERLEKALTEVEQMPPCATRYDTIQRLSNQIEILERLKEGGE